MIVAEDDALDVPLARPVPAVRVNAVDPVVVVVVGGGGRLRVLPVHLDGVPVGGHALPLQPHDCAVCVSGGNKKTCPQYRASRRKWMAQRYHGDPGGGCRPSRRFA